MVATGCHDDTLEGTHDASRLDSVETIQILETDNEVTVETCLKSVPAYPLKVGGTAGTTLINGEPLICGGKSPTTDTCYKLVNNEWREAPQLPTGRMKNDDLDFIQYLIFHSSKNVFKTCVLEFFQIVFLFLQLLPI